MVCPGFSCVDHHSTVQCNCKVQYSIENTILVRRRCNQETEIVFNFFIYESNFWFFATCAHKKSNFPDKQLQQGNRAIFYVTIFPYSLNSWSLILDPWFLILDSWFLQDLKKFQSYYGLNKKNFDKQPWFLILDSLSLILYPWFLILAGFEEIPELLLPQQEKFR